MPRGRAGRPGTNRHPPAVVSRSPPPDAACGMQPGAVQSAKPRFFCRNNACCLLPGARISANHRRIRGRNAFQAPQSSLIGGEEVGWYRRLAATVGGGAWSPHRGSVSRQVVTPGPSPSTPLRRASRWRRGSQSACTPATARLSPGTRLRFTPATRWHGPRHACPMTSGVFGPLARKNTSALTSRVPRHGWWPEAAFSAKTFWFPSLGASVGM